MVQSRVPKAVRPGAAVRRPLAGRAATLYLDPQTEGEIALRWGAGASGRLRSIVRRFGFVAREHAMELQHVFTSDDLDRLQAAWAGLPDATREALQPTHERDVLAMAVRAVGGPAARELAGRVEGLERAAGCLLVDLVERRLIGGPAGG